MTTLSRHELLKRAHRLWTVWVFFRATMGRRVPEELDWTQISKLRRSDLSTGSRMFCEEISEALEHLFGPRCPFAVDDAATRFQEDAQGFLEALQAETKFVVGRVYEFEARHAPLRVEEQHGFETPAYGIIMLQGFQGFTVRYPEYHLAIDVCSLHKALVEELAALAEQRRRGEPHNTEWAQTLARSEIGACYNLLESVPNGLAAEWRIRNPNASNPAIEGLSERRPALPLFRRFLELPAALTGNPAARFDRNQEPFRSLFGRLRERRNYIVHLRPETGGDGRPDRVAVEDLHFHDIPLTEVEETIEATLAAIQAVWPSVRGKPAPSWLPLRGDDGLYRYHRIQAGASTAVAQPTNES